MSGIVQNGGDVREVIKNYHGYKDISKVVKAQLRSGGIIKEGSEAVLPKPLEKLEVNFENVNKEEVGQQSH